MPTGVQGDSSDSLHRADSEGADDGECEQVADRECF
jgi:hypothetical protein